jgi:glycosyltransferase involved in cell wall biosynthesis
VRVAIVTPWYGADLIGGAERLAWDLSQALARSGAEVDVLTTCCRSFHDDWSANYHRPGVSDAGGVTVRRFRVDQRDRVAFSRANSALLALRYDQLRRDLAPLPAATTDAFVTQGIRSPALLRELREHGREYDAILFLPYLYTTTVEGLPLVAERAFLIPCLHDEAYAYLDPIRNVFRQARGLLFNSDGELDVAASLYGPWVHARSTVIGHAVDVATAKSDAPPIKGFIPQRSRYLLFLGRGDKTKNIDLALEAFARFREARQTTSLQLIVAGPHARPVAGADGVIDVGAVTEDGKAALLAHARAVVQPSTNESFSRTVYEAWQLRRPVVVHADCVATAAVVEASGGGWTARTVEEWARVFAMIDESSDTAIDGVGMRGRAVALRAGSWDDVAARTLEAIRTRLAEPKDVMDRIVSLEQRSVPRAPQPRFDDVSVNVLSLAPLRTETDGARLGEIFGLLHRKVDRVRLLLFGEACDAVARESLERITTELGIGSDVVILDEDIDAHYAAFRDAQVACAFGSRLETDDQISIAKAFDIPVVAYADAIAERSVAQAGIICDRDALEEAGVLLFLVATDRILRSKIVAELRRTRGEHDRETSRTF